jgi:hypothetical protein
MTTVQRVAQIFGWVFVLAAIAGFVASQGSMESDVEQAPRALGLFPVNLLHNFVHLAFGIWGIVAARSWSAAKGYCQAGGVIYLVLAVLGFFIPETFGLMPIGGNDIWLHILLGGSLAYFGFTARARFRARCRLPPEHLPSAPRGAPPRTVPNPAFHAAAHHAGRRLHQPALRREPRRRLRPPRPR